MTLPILKLYPNRPKEAIAIMQEVAAWGRSQGFRIWPENWLTSDQLITSESPPESFFLGTISGEPACTFILQQTDQENWGPTPPGKAVYLHKFCVLRRFAHQNMTQALIHALRLWCRPSGTQYIRLDTALDEKVIRKIYLQAGFKIVDIIDYPNGRSLALYELEL